MAPPVQYGRLNAPLARLENPPEPREWSYRECGQLLGRSQLYRTANHERWVYLHQAGGREWSHAKLPGEARYRSPEKSARPLLHTDAPHFAQLRPTPAGYPWASWLSHPRFHWSQF